jgi:hypothetical protein
MDNAQLLTNSIFIKKKCKRAIHMQQLLVQKDLSYAPHPKLSLLLPLQYLPCMLICANA